MTKLGNSAIKLLVLIFPILVGENVFGATVSEFVMACNNSSNLGEEICQCVGENAEQDLSPQGFEMLIAMLNKDQAEADRLRSQLPHDEVVQVGLYMVNQPNECAQELLTQ